MGDSLPSVKTAIVNTVEPIDIQVTDINGNPIDATVLELQILDLGSNILFSDSFTNPPVGGSQIVKPGGTIGYYYYPFGTPLGSPATNTQTDHIQDYIFMWTIASAGSQRTTVMQNVKVISALTCYQIPYLRLMVDKARKVVDPASDVFLGYTDAQLVMFMESGLQIINSYQPESAVFSLDSYPWQAYRHIALESSLMAGVLSQQLFAIDTDMPNYSDQGTAFVIAHQPQLAALLNQICQRLDKNIPNMKMQFVSTGSIHLAAGPSYKMGALLAAAPSGSLFRNVFFRS
jgi:hypothetical protein